nr:hypothetical protein GCM10020241_47780 [Streptoalloteichus tenebrarius]
MERGFGGGTGSPPIPWPGPAATTTHRLSVRRGGTVNVTDPAWPGYMWQPWGERRHAYRGGRRPDGENVVAFCGTPLTTTSYPGDNPPEWQWPECSACAETVSEIADRRALVERRRRHEIEDLHAYGGQPLTRHTRRA